MDSSTQQKAVVIEGPDGSGKTTLIKKAFPGAIHNGGPPETSIELFRRMYDLKPGQVYDRWSAISELIYSIPTRGRYLLPVSDMHRAIQNFQPIIIYCRPPNDVLERNVLTAQETKPHKSREHIDRVIANREDLRDRYDELFYNVLPGLGCTIFHFDYTTQISQRKIKT